MEQLPFGTNEFADNPEPRVPCVLVLDVSGSMQGEPIRQLNEGLIVYKDSLSADPLARKRVEVAIVTFGSEVKSVCDFVTADNYNPPTLEPSGYTPMGQAVTLAMEMVENRKTQYKSNGIAYYRPWLFLITDGGPNDPGWEAAAAKAVEGDKAKKFAFFGVGTDGADFGNLQKFCVREPLKLKGLEFKKLFQWLSSSQQSVSRSTPGDEVPLANPAAHERLGIGVMRLLCGKLYTVVCKAHRTKYRVRPAKMLAECLRESTQFRYSLQCVRMAKEVLGIQKSVQILLANRSFARFRRHLLL